jgi:hypothetical protein
MYDPSTGRWLTPVADEIPSYAFGGNAPPATGGDPSGLIATGAYPPNQDDELVGASGVAQMLGATAAGVIADYQRRQREKEPNQSSSSCAIGNQAPTGKSGGAGPGRGTQAEKIMAPAKRASGSTVLGHYPEYMNMADSLGHRRFDIPKAAWDKMTDAERWTANQKFLDRTISRGDKILLSTPLDKVKPGSYFERELQYLSGKGYSPNADATRLVPGGN